MLNKIFLMGRLVADPEAKQTPSGVPVTTFRIAVDRDFKNKQTGEKEADFVTIVAWRGTAEFVAKYFTKGRMAVVEGRLQMRDWTDKDGNKRTSAEVVADNVYFGDSKRDSDGGGSYSPGYRQGGFGQEGSYSQQPAPRSDSYGGGDALSGYGAPPADGDNFSELTTDEGDLPF